MKLFTKGTLVLSCITAMMLMAKLLVEHYLGYHTTNIDKGEALVYWKYPVLILGIAGGFFIVNKQNKKIEIGYKELLFSGILQSLSIALVFGVFVAGYYLFINNEYEVLYKDFVIKKIESSDLSSDHKLMQKSQFKQQMIQHRWMMTYWGASLIAFIETFMVSLLASLLLAFFFRRKKVSSPVKQEK